MNKVLFCLCMMLCFSCNKSVEKQDHTVLSFYYWRTHFSLDSIERESLKDLNVEKLYIRYFDIALQDDQAIPVSPIMFNEKIPGLEVVPVVYIKNEVMLKEKLNIPELAKHITNFIEQINTKNKIESTELQLDCDWSITSRDRFFDLIAELKKVTSWKISVTIRLHQVKYASKTGIPEVDHGVLMYYNMGKIANDSLNSIYERSIAKKYIGALQDYPLRLDYALPIYSWLIQSRNGQVVKLISRVRVESLKENKAFKHIHNNRYQVVVEGDYFGQYFKVGDEVKVESTSDQQLREMITDLRKASGKCPQEIILYDLNTKNIVFYEKETFKELVTCK